MPFRTAGREKNLHPLPQIKTKPNWKEVMNDQFDELAKTMAQSVTRRGALKKFGFGLAGVVVTALGLANRLLAHPGFHCQCKKPDLGCSKSKDPQGCFAFCGIYCSQ